MTNRKSTRMWLLTAAVIAAILGGAMGASVGTEDDALCADFATASTCR